VPTASTQIDELQLPMTSTTPLAGFAELYEHHYETVFRAALRVTGNAADAEDVLQTVFLRVLARRGDCAGANRLRTSGATAGQDAPAHDVEEVALPAAYFRRAAVNAAVDVLRRRELHAESVYDEGTPHPTVQTPVLLKERLRRAVAVLDSDDASLFLLRHVEGLSIEELAGMFQIEKNNVAVRLHRIRHRLQAEMER
jgi:RNA polymerase sigma-70 factor (ECF subfamily)